TSPDPHRHRRAGHPRPKTRAYRAAVMAPPETSESALTRHYDVDRLLAGYRTARAQEALFDFRPSGTGGSGGPGIGYDEFVDEDGTIRRTWTELADTVAERGRAGLDRLRSVVHSLLDNDGITYTGGPPKIEAHRNGHEGAAKSQGLEPGLWTLDT